MRAQIRVLASENAAREEYESFVRRHNLKKLSYYSYLKSKVAFECARDAGLWHIGYDITDQEPSSSQIWAQWKKYRGAPLGITAYAECDEVSALYAVLARRLGVNGIGLFWPQSNHTVAVWKLEGKRIVVPTTPIFLERHDGFDCQGFDPQSQAVIYDYTAPDINSRTRLPTPLVRFFLAQVKNYGGASQELLHELRYLREAVWLGEAVHEPFKELKRRFTSAADRRALQTFSRQFRLRL